MAREELGKTYGLPIFFELPEGKKAILGRLLSCNYLVTVAMSPAVPSPLLKGSYVLAWTLDGNDVRVHDDPLLVSEAGGFTFFNDNQNRRFEVHAPVVDMLISIIPMFGTVPAADQSGPTTIPAIVISDIT